MFYDMLTGLFIFVFVSGLNLTTLFCLSPVRNLGTPLSQSYLLPGVPLLLALALWLLELVIYALYDINRLVCTHLYAYLHANYEHF